MLAQLPKEDLVQLQRAAVIAFLVHDCLSLLEVLARDLERHYRFSSSDFVRYQVRSIPTEIENIILSHSCVDRFGPAVLSASNLFYNFVRRSPCDCLEWTDKCCCHLKTWRLDLDPRLAPRGLILPLRDRQYGFFTDLLVFRHVRDEKPFRLQLRSEREVAA